MLQWQTEQPVRASEPRDTALHDSQRCESDRGLCHRIAQRLERSVGARQYGLWFSRSAKLDYHDQHRRLEVAVPNRFVADWIDRHFSEDLHQAVRHELGVRADLRVRVNPDLFGPCTTDAPAKGVAARRGGAQRLQTPPAADPNADPPLSHSRERSFGRRIEQFVVGPCNELAYVASNRVVDEEQATVNPLFIHGGCGLGKTHLLQGICQKMCDQKPYARVHYTTAEQFTNEFLTAVRTNKIDRFRRWVRRLDLLAVDDVHFLANKQATQQEFLHSFDAIEQGGARVVLASDSHPKLIEQFSDALVSRCVRGMVVQVRPPSTDTRAKIIRVLAQRRGLVLLDSVVDVLARRCGGSVREIEGTLTQLHALAHLRGQSQPGGGGGDGTGAGGGGSAGSGAGGQPIGHALLNLLFHCDPAPVPRQAVHFDAILRAVSDQMHMPTSQVLGSSRHQHAVLARSLVAYLARKMTRMSYPEVAAAMGRRTHSTVISAAQRVKRQLAAHRVLLLPGEAVEVSLMEVVERLEHRLARG